MIADAREDLEGKLELAGLRVILPSGSVAPPCVLVIPGDPWVTPAQLGGRYREIAYRVVGVVGTGEERVQRDECEAMAQAIADGIHASPPWTLATIDPPAAYGIGDVSYLAVIGTTRIQIGGT